MSKIAFFWGVLLGCAGLLGCGASEDSTKESNSSTAVALTAAAPACALLDDPAVRSRISGALETKLALECDPVATAARSTRAAEPGRRLRSGAALAELGTDIAVSDPSLDIGGSTQSESSIVANGNVVCAAWNDSGEGFGP